MSHSPVGVAVTTLDNGVDGPYYGGPTDAKEGVPPYLTRDLGPVISTSRARHSPVNPMSLSTPKIVGARWPNRSLRAIEGLKSVDTRSVTNRMGRNTNRLLDDSAGVQNRERGCVYARSGTSHGSHQGSSCHFDGLKAQVAQALVSAKDIC